jgi:hypothetical protein
MLSQSVKKGDYILKLSWKKVTYPNVKKDVGK